MSVGCAVEKKTTGRDVATDASLYIIIKYNIPILRTRIHTPSSQYRYDIIIIIIITRVVDGGGSTIRRWPHWQHCRRRRRLA